MLRDFNILATTIRGNESQMCHELKILFEEIGDNDPKISKTGIRGVIVSKTSLDAEEAIKKFRDILQLRPFEFRYSLRIIPIQKVIPTELDKIKKVAIELSAGIQESEKYRVTVEKRFTQIHTNEIIEAAASEIKNKADMKNPDKILLIEVLGGFTGIAVLKPNSILNIMKEKML